MREIVIVSGKGGAGKTSISGAFAHLSANSILCDLDVDTPDLHILLSPQHKEHHEFWSGYEATITPSNCTQCGLCEQVCKFDAVQQINGSYHINPMQCEGCKSCVVQCPANAIEFTQKHCGNWFVSDTRFGTMVHARLFPGEENSGRLVTILKAEARQLAKQTNANLIIADGSPGIGCPVISSLQGVRLAVIVTEPTPSGKHDFERVAKLCDHFSLAVAVIINKANINPQETHNIKTICTQRGYTHVADLPFDSAVTHAMVARKVITEFSDTEFSHLLANAWKKIEQLAEDKYKNF